jgi:hypothetical protein
MLADLNIVVREAANGESADKDVGAPLAVALPR